MMFLSCFVFSLVWIHGLCMDKVFVPVNYTSPNIQIGFEYDLLENKLKDMQVFSEVEMEKPEIKECTESYAFVKTPEDAIKLKGIKKYSILTISDKLMNMENAALNFLRRPVNRSAELEIAIFVDCISRKEIMDKGKLAKEEWSNKPTFYVKEVIYGSQLFLSYKFLPKADTGLDELQSEFSRIIKSNPKADGFEIINVLLSELKEKLLTYTVTPFAQGLSSIAEVYLSVEEVRDYVKGMSGNPSEDIIGINILPFNPFMDSLLPWLEDVSETLYLTQVWKNRYPNLGKETLKFVNELQGKVATIKSHLAQNLQPAEFLKIRENFLQCMSIYQDGLKLTDTTYVDKWSDFLEEQEEAKPIKLNTPTVKRLINDVEKAFELWPTNDDYSFYGKVIRDLSISGRNRRVSFSRRISGSRRMLRSGVMMVPTSGLYLVSYSVQKKSGGHVIIQTQSYRTKEIIAQAESKACRSCSQTLSGSFVTTLNSKDILVVYARSKDGGRATIGANSYFSGVLLKKLPDSK